MQSFVLCVDQPTDCQREEEEHSYRRFVKVVIGIIILALLLVLFRKVGVIILVFVLRVNGFSCNNLCCSVVHELSSVWRLCIISKFCKGVF